MKVTTKVCLAALGNELGSWWRGLHEQCGGWGEGKQTLNLSVLFTSTPAQKERGQERDGPRWRTHPQ